MGNESGLISQSGMLGFGSRSYSLLVWRVTPMFATD